MHCGSALLRSTPQCIIQVAHLYWMREPWNSRYPRFSASRISLDQSPGSPRSSSVGQRILRHPVACAFLLALVHESAWTPTLALSGCPDPSWRSRGQRYGRSAVEPSQPPVQEEVQNPELKGVRAWPQEPRRRHDLAERGCNCRVGTNEERSSRRPAAVLEPRGPDRVDAAGRLQPAAPPDRGVPGLAAPLDGPQPQGPGPHHTLAPEPNRCGAAHGEGNGGGRWN